MSALQNMRAQNTQPIGWPTSQYKRSLKSVLPARASGTNMTMMRRIKPEFLPTANNKLPDRWRKPLLPPLKKPRAPWYAAYVDDPYPYGPGSATTLLSDTTPLTVPAGSERRSPSGSQRQRSNRHKEGEPDGSTSARARQSTHHDTPSKSSQSAHPKTISSAKAGGQDPQERMPSGHDSRISHPKTNPSARSIRPVPDQTQPLAKSGRSSRDKAHPSAKGSRSGRAELTASAKTSRSAADEYESSLDKSVPLGISQSAKTRSVHLDVRPPSVYSDYSVSIRLPCPPPRPQPWTIGHELNIDKLKNMLRENTYHAGNFSTLSRSDKATMVAMVNRLSYDPYVRRAQLAVERLPEDPMPTKSLTKEEINKLVKRLNVVKVISAEDLPPEKSPDRELTDKEQEFIKRMTQPVEPLCKRQQNREQSGEEEQDKPKMVTKAELEEILKRLTQTKQELEVENKENEVVECNKVTEEELEAILTRLMTFDAARWPPESKPQIFKPDPARPSTGKTRKQ